MLTDMDDEIFNKEPLSSSKAAAEDKCAVSDTCCQNDFVVHPLNNCNNDMDYKVKIKEEVLCQDSASFRVTSESEASAVGDTESRIGVDHFSLESEESKRKKIIQGGDNGMDIKIELKEELYYNLLTIVKPKSSDSAIQDIELQQSNCNNDMDDKVKIKEQFLCQDYASFRVTFESEGSTVGDTESEGSAVGDTESEDSAVGDTESQRGVAHFSSESKRNKIMQGGDNGMGNKMKLKEELFYDILAAVTSKSSETAIQDIDLQQSNCNNDVDYKAKVKEQFLCQDSASFRVTSESEASAVRDTESQLGVAHFSSDSEESKRNKIIQEGDNEMAIKIELKEELYYNLLTVVKSKSSDSALQDIELQQSITSFSRDSEGSEKCRTTIREDDNDMFTKIEIKDESLYIDNLLTIHKAESEDFAMGDKITTVSPDTGGSEKCSVIQKADNEIEIKEEPWWLERTSTEIKCEGGPSSTSDIDLQCVVEDSMSCMAGISTTEASRLHTEESLRDTNVTRFFMGSSLKRLTKDATNCETPNTYEVYEKYDSEKKLSTTSPLQQHQLLHEGTRPNKCNVCEKTFLKKSYLKRHQFIHEDTRSYKCNICEKSLKHASDIKRHQLSHEGIRPYKCNSCEKSFTRAAYLKQHRLLHEGTGPYKCNGCKKSFTQASNLKRHHCNKLSTSTSSTGGK